MHTALVSCVVVTFLADSSDPFAYYIIYGSHGLGPESKGGPRINVSIRRKKKTLIPRLFLSWCNCVLIPWWRHQMETCSALLAICAGNSPVTGQSPAQRPVTRSFDVFFDLSKQWWGWWFETPSAHYDVTVMRYHWRSHEGYGNIVRYLISMKHNKAQYFRIVLERCGVSSSDAVFDSLATV